MKASCFEIPSLASSLPPLPPRLGLSGGDLQFVAAELGALSHSKSSEPFSYGTDDRRPGGSNSTPGPATLLCMAGLTSAAHAPLVVRLALLPVLVLEGAVILALLRSRHVRRLIERGASWRRAIALLAFLAVLGAVIALRVGNSIIVAGGPRRLDGMLALEFLVAQLLLLGPTLWMARQRRSGN